MKLRYRYNSETCRYEPIVVSPRLFVKNTFKFLGISFLLGLGGIAYYNSQYPLLDEVLKLDENSKLKTEWQAIHSQLKKTSQQLAELENNDDHNFRVILDMDPLSSTQREAGVGGREKASAEITYPTIRTALDFSEKIKNRLTVEVQSMNELKSALTSKQKQWAARPAIQPINNKQLIHLYLVFGQRFLPQDGYFLAHTTDWILLRPIIVQSMPPAMALLLMPTEGPPMETQFLSVMATDLKHATHTCQNSSYRLGKV